ncbi:hypothetical protein [Streptomyces sp. CB02009]|uniref:hypothetical protein n=1 Tax=Streptomyces sp. CB02009 TaxID=1703938 RepID=UPI0030833031
MDSELVRVCLEVLEQARLGPAEDADRRLLEVAAARLLRDGRRQRRLEARGSRAKADAKLQATTATGAVDRVMDTALPTVVPARPGLGVGDYIEARHEKGAKQQPSADVTSTGETPRLLHRPQRCYVCKDHYRQVHHFYHLLCPRCADEGFARRTARTDLAGRRSSRADGSRSVSRPP